MPVEYFLPGGFVGLDEGPKLFILQPGFGKHTGETPAPPGDVLHGLGGAELGISYIEEVVFDRGRPQLLPGPSAGVCATFDRLGNLTSTIRSINKDNLSVSGAIDARGYMSVDQANAAGVINTTDQRNNAVNNTYSATGSLGSRVDAGYSPYQFSYNGLGLPDLFADPLGKQIRFAYDDLGRLVLRTDARGLTQSFVYDTLGRVTKRTDSGSVDINYTYDADGRLLTASKPNTTTAYVTYNYDSAGKLTQATYNDVQPGQSVFYTHGFLNGLTGIADWNGNGATYAYDSLGRLQALGSSYYGANLTLSYDANGNVTGKTSPDGTTETYTYDKENRMASFTLNNGFPIVAGATYVYDAAGNRTLTQVNRPGFTGDSFVWVTR